jgi:hypothetical protein
VISGSVSGVADGSLLMGCDILLDVSKGTVASIFKVKQSCWTVLNVRVTRCILAGDVDLMLCDLICITGYCTGELEFPSFSSGNWEGNAFNKSATIPSIYVSKWNFHSILQ